MTAAALMFTSRRAGRSHSTDTASPFAALFLRWLDLDARLSAAEDVDDMAAWKEAARDLAAVQAAALRLEPATADDMRRRVVICCNAPLATDRGSDAAVIREARHALWLIPNG